MVEVVPLSVGRASREWDERHIDLESAQRQVKNAPTSGFTSNVSGNAARFMTEWDRHIKTLADQAEGHADGLRTVISNYVNAEGVVDINYAQLQGYLLERR